MPKKIYLDGYLDMLAARSPAPGGGSAAALVGSIGMSLVSMAAKYISKKDGSGNTGRVIRSSETARRRLRRLMDEDEAAYLRLWKDLKSGAKNKTNSYKKAVKVPLEVCGLANQGMRWCEYLCRRSRTSIICDVAEAAVLLEAAFLSAALNATINLCGVKDRSYTKRVSGLLLRQKRLVNFTKTKILKRYTDKADVY